MTTAAYVDQISISRFADVRKDGILSLRCAGRCDPNCLH